MMRVSPAGKNSSTASPAYAPSDETETGPAGNFMPDVFSMRTQNFGCVFSLRCIFEKTENFSAGSFTAAIGIITLSCRPIVTGFTGVNVNISADTSDAATFRFTMSRNEPS